MNSDYQEGNRGELIIPSARRSIHSYRDSEMGRYGLNQSGGKNNRANSPGNNQQGADEVDNIMSKLSHQASPLSIRRKYNRSNSYSQDEENTDNESHVLSKSLPSTLPSHLYSSDDSDTIDPSHFGKSRLEDSQQTPERLNSVLSRSHDHSDHRPRTPFQSSPLQRAPRQTRCEQEDKLNFKFYAAVIIVIIAAGIIFVNPTMFKNIQKSSSHKSTQTINYDEIFENNLKTLQHKYNIDRNSILKLKTGISTIFARMDTGSFMFVYNSKTNNFNSSQFEQFINEVSYTAARYLRNDVSSIKHTVVLSSNLDMEEHGELINKYRDDVDKTGVLLVKEIDGVPSDLAMAFHYYCDEYDPLVKRSAIFFTLNIANCSNSSDKKSTHDFIEKCLAGKWTTVPTENMRPLLTRVVDIIIDVTSVF